MNKALALVGAFVYLILPIDLLPEIILGPIGLLDDLGVLAAAAAYVMKATPAQLREPVGPVRRELDDDGPPPRRRPADHGGVAPLRAAGPAAPKLVVAERLPPLWSDDEVARLAADAAVRPLAGDTTEERRLQLHAAVHGEVLRALQT